MNSSAQATLYAISTALFFAITFFLRKQAVRFIPFQFAFLIESIFYLLFPLILFLILPGPTKKAAIQNFSGIKLAFFAGIFAFIGVTLNYLALKNGFLSKIVSVQMLAQIIFGILLGYVLLKESISVIQFAGIILGLISVILITH